MKIFLYFLEINGLILAVLDFLNLTKKLEKFIDIKRTQMEKKFQVVKESLSSQVEIYMESAKKKFDRIFLGLFWVLTSAFFFTCVIETFILVMGIFSDKAPNPFQIFYNIEGWMDSWNYVQNTANRSALWIIIWFILISHVILILFNGSLMVYMYIKSKKLFAHLFFLISFIFKSIIRTVVHFLKLIDKAPSGTVGTIGLSITVLSWLLSHIFN
jgi:hypothetical protein